MAVEIEIKLKVDDLAPVRDRLKSLGATLVGEVIEKLIDCYLERRDSDAERFIDVVHRLGVEPFKEKVYGNAYQRTAGRNREPVLA